MIRRSFLQFFSAALLPKTELPAKISANHESSPSPSASMLPAAGGVENPEWLREWKSIPRLEITLENLPIYSDPDQQAVAEDILPCIHNGSPFTFRYLGGSQPGGVRTVLPVLLFVLDYYSFFFFRCDDPADIPDPDVAPLYLLGWCQSRNAPRTFRLDRMSLIPQPSTTS